MKCHDVENLLNWQMDGDELPILPEFERHLAECQRCQELHQASQLFQTGVQKLSLPAPPAELTGRIVARAQVQRRWRTARRYAGAALAAAAMFLIMTLPFAGFISVINKNRKDRSKPSVVMDGRHYLKEKSRQNLPSLRANVEKAGTAVASLTERWAAQSQKRASLLWQAAAEKGMEPMAKLPRDAKIDSAFDPAAESLQEAGKGVSTGLQPVADSARQALAFLVREIPGAKKH